MPDRKGPDAGFYKGLIQVAAGCLHYTRHNRRGAVNKWTQRGRTTSVLTCPGIAGCGWPSSSSAVDGFLAAMAQRRVARPRDADDRSGVRGKPPAGT